MGQKRTRKNAFVVRLNDDEQKQMEHKMEALGITNREAYVRKMILDGYIIKIDTKPTSELIRLIKNATNNINQVAKRANETGSVYENDVLDLAAVIDKLVPLVVEAYSNSVRLGRK